MPSESYPFAVGRIRGLERRLLNQSDFNRIAEQSSALAVKFLADSGYGIGAENREDADELIDAEMEILYRTIDELTPDKEITDLFFITQDAVNLKLLLKARLLGETIEDGELSRGIFNVSLLKSSVDTRKYNDIPEKLTDALAGVEKMIDEEAVLGNIDPFAVSTEVDKAIYGFAFDRLSKKKNPFVLKYYKAKVDFTNFLSMLRARALGWKKENFSQVIIDGGDIDKKTLLDSYDLAPDALDQKVKFFGGLIKAIRRGLEVYLDGDNSINAAAAVFDQALKDIAAEERYDSFGIGPIVNYITKKTDEAARLRVLFTKIRSNETSLRQTS